MPNYLFNSEPARQYGMALAREYNASPFDEQGQRRVRPRTPEEQAMQDAAQDIVSPDRMQQAMEAARLAESQQQSRNARQAAPIDFNLPDQELVRRQMAGDQTGFMRRFLVEQSTGGRYEDEVARLASGKPASTISPFRPPIYSDVDREGNNPQLDPRIINHPAFQRLRATNPREATEIYHRLTRNKLDSGGGDFVSDLKEQMAYNQNMQAARYAEEQYPIARDRAAQERATIVAERNAEAERDYPEQVRRAQAQREAAMEQDRAFKEKHFATDARRHEAVQSVDRGAFYDQQGAKWWIPEMVEVPDPNSINGTIRTKRLRVADEYSQTALNEHGWNYLGKQPPGPPDLRRADQFNQMIKPGNPAWDAGVVQDILGKIAEVEARTGQSYPPALKERILAKAHLAKAANTRLGPWQRDLIENEDSWDRFFERGSYAKPQVAPAAPAFDANYMVPGGTY